MRTIELENGDTAQLTLDNVSLLRLREADNKAYRAYFKVVSDSKWRADDPYYASIQVIYAAYRCAQIKAGTDEDSLSYDEFLTVLPQDLNVIVGLGVSLMNPNLKRASGNPSEKQPTAQEEAT